MKFKMFWKSVFFCQFLEIVRKNRETHVVLKGHDMLVDFDWHMQRLVQNPKAVAGRQVCKDGNS